MCIRKILGAAVLLLVFGSSACAEMYRVKVGLLCDKRVIKLVKKNFQYMGIHTNGTQKAVYCRRQ